MSTLRKLLAAVAAGAATLALAACSGTPAASPSGTESSAALTTVTVGASPVPHAKILEFVKEKLAPAAGIDLQIVEFDDYVQPNEALASKELDANYFQHLPYLEAQIKERGYAFEHGAGVHIEPYAAFSKKYTSLADLPQGASIAITNDASNQIRGLRVLETAGLLTGITDDSNVLNLTAEQNPKGFKFVENQPEVIVQQLDDPAIDLAFVNGNFILTAGLSTADALAVEKVEDNPYANLLVWRTDNTNPGVAKLEEFLHSPEVADFIKQTWPSGDVLPG
ncbi:MetQ/NlpA family ABC transporter substrate-binding protein [Micropruina sonneratiae]|uniref:MetQ/NlpA family ABC transporter substrate-binding protein n=1 Tax=Micropruina sonneratiae TaxID=2986940 RepID=UPI002226EA32|nr:MetQ/NlpA family ABC transporter substrate-binding protein [Micropruina sp. KQZ13P-5]MCW3156403.1 MetQ/NlpA family ABC transporter substrate-binding protein [Micropruina sp. KQZ13P-5]